MASPLHQFEIQPLLSIEIGGINASFTNSSMAMVVAVAAAYGVLMFGMRERALVPNRMQSVAELVYEFIGNMIRTNVGAEGRRYFPFIFSLFMFVLFGNMLG